MLDKLKEDVFRANLELVRYGLVIMTWGNVSGIDRESGLMVIKPSGVSYNEMTAGDMVVTDLEGRVVEGTLKPSTDAPTHRALYKAFPGIGGVVHTHSTHATAWAQACRPIPCLGTTHADYFYGPVPVTRRLTPEETDNEYEYNTGLVISEALAGTDPMTMPAVLVASHGPFTWGTTPAAAVHNAVILEEVARMAALSAGIAPPQEIDRHLLDRHYLRKHGSNAYYGQKKNK
ncbi:MAG TPA: L-ribulose-5-phosphate 4-epimerase [Bacteroidales bacterium]|jgi:L-ribulose-5-phosphate 4-epimerase|nr:L-ribulose-5-phosphate 4-epimerase [Bacteroidales bacterium]NLD62836.1 L-ribulose-5-phosphate 4-epimerase [Bacteroidales bacterium]HRW26535.1 L-ribulose-5-phosphate 4-epimerase [Bacteroidales bacterium]